RADFRQGIEVPRDEPSEDRKAEGFAGFLRSACKMATGAGKTTVMGMKIRSRRYVESDTALIQRIIGREIGGKKNLLVMNDEANRGPGSTAAVDFWTSRDVREVVKSHVNCVAADTKKWEQQAAYFVDTHAGVRAFV
ncbi:MAG: hypothetical protein ABIZ56_12000, partial [Chthoniobacteraceae bacterium]